MSRPNRTATSRRGFMLIHMLLAIGLFTIFSLAAYRLIRLSLRISADVSRLENHHLRHDASFARLREDVWGAVAIGPVGKKGLRIRKPGRETVTWTADSEGALVRSEATRGSYPKRQSWPGVGENILLRVDGPTVSITLPGRGDTTDRTVLLVSQVMLTTEGQP